MFNLLPQPEKRELSKEYRLRLAAMSLFLLGFLGIFAFITFSPSYFLSSQKERETRLLAETLKRDSALGSREELTAILKLADKETKLLKAFKPVSHTFELVDDVTENKTSRIKIMGLRINRNDDGSRNVAVIGKAVNRDALLSFVRVLEQEEDFSSVTVPVSNFAGAEDINFSILIKAK